MHQSYLLLLICSITHDQVYRQASFGVGFDLTASDGPAAVSFANVIITTITKITGSDEYNEVLACLSRSTSRHPYPPYDNLGEVWDDMPRQWLRKAKKAIDLPASSDVGYLADSLGSL